MEDKDFIEDENFNITDHIVKKENTNWEKKWKASNDYLIYRLPECHFDTIHVRKSNEPWYRRFENKKRKKR